MELLSSLARRAGRLIERIRQRVTNHLKMVPQERTTAGERQMVPVLRARQSAGDSTDFLVSVRRGAYEKQLAGLVADEQVIAGEQKLAVAETALLPFPRPVFGVDASQNALVHAVQVAVVQHGAGELAPHVPILPQLLDGPLVAVLGRLDHRATVVVAGRDEDAVAVQDDRLGDVDVHVRRPREAPELAAGFGVIAGNPFAVEQEHLSDAADGRQLRRAISGPAGAAGP